MNVFSETTFADRVVLGQPLSALTTLGVGGPADYYIAPTSRTELSAIIDVANRAAIPFTVIGNGSNILAADAGYRGLIIHNKLSGRSLVQDAAYNTDSLKKTEPRWQMVEGAPNIAPYDESTYPEAFVSVEGGCMVQRLMIDLLREGITGLEWYSGIPATVGGAVYMNMHGGKKFFGDNVVSATVVTRAGEVKELSHAELRFAYDWSVLHDTRDTVLSAVLRLRRGPVEGARAIMTAWLKHKNETQPKRSCGSVFRNISPEEQKRLNIPTPGAGYVIDKLLGLNGKQIGGARIADNNGNFMVNTGSAHAEDFAILIAFVKERARNELGLALFEEVEYLGFGTLP